MSTSRQKQKNNISEENGWDFSKKKATSFYLHKLKHNQVICNFFFFQLKSKESLISWWLIILSTLSTTLTGLNNIEKEPFDHFFTSIQIGLGTFSVSTTLIAAWMKNKQFVERINETDRYVKKVTRLIEEIEFQLMLGSNDRMVYDDFKKKYHSQISEILSTSPSLSPKEWKYTIYTITKHYPEMINADGTSDTKLWPWFTLGTKYKEKNGKMEGEIVRRVSPFGGKVMNTYHSSTYKGYIIQKCCSCFLNKTLLYPDPTPPPPRRTFKQKYCSCFSKCCKKKNEIETQTDNITDNVTDNVDEKISERP